MTNITELLDRLQNQNHSDKAYYDQLIIPESYNNRAIINTNIALARATQDNARDALNGAAQSETVLQSAAETARDDAITAKTASETAQGKAEHALGLAEQVQAEAAESASDAAISAANALQSANNAATSATASETAKGQAESARDDAVAAKNAAETAQTAAESAQASTAEIAAGISVTMSNVISHIGQVIFSTTLDTMEKVIAVYGGTQWVKIEGRFIIGADGSHSAGSTGGNEKISHSHTAATSAGTAITEAQMPSHKHEITGYSNPPNRNVFGAVYRTDNNSSGDNSQPSVNGNNGNMSLEYYWSIAYSGGNQAHSHSIPASNSVEQSIIPPYKAVHIWE